MTRHGMTWCDLSHGTTRYDSSHGLFDDCRLVSQAAFLSAMAAAIPTLETEIDGFARELQQQQQADRLARELPAAGRPLACEPDASVAAPPPPALLPHRFVPFPEDAAAGGSMGAGPSSSANFEETARGDGVGGSQHRPGEAGPRRDGDAPPAPAPSSSSRRGFLSSAVSRLATLVRVCLSACLSVCPSVHWPAPCVYLQFQGSRAHRRAFGLQ
jgi:hypothetical protein